MQELFQSTGCDRIRKIEVGGLRIFVGRVVGEVGTDDEEILFVEIRFQNLRNLLEDGETLGADHDGHDRRDFSENQLKERQLDLQVMFPVVGVCPANERPFSLSDEFFAQGDIDRNLSQRRFRPGIERIYARPGKSDTMTGPEEEDPFVRVPPGDAVVGRRSHLSAEYVSRVGDDNRLRSKSIPGRMKPGSQHGLDLFRGRGVKAAGDGRLSHFLGF